MPPWSLMAYGVCISPLKGGSDQRQSRWRIEQRLVTELSMQAKPWLWEGFFHGSEAVDDTNLRVEDTKHVNASENRHGRLRNTRNKSGEVWQYLSKWCIHAIYFAPNSTDSTLIWSLVFLAIILYIYIHIYIYIIYNIYIYRIYIYTYIYIYYSQYIWQWLTHAFFCIQESKTSAFQYIHTSWWTARCWKGHGWNLQSLMDTTQDSPEDSDLHQPSGHRTCIFWLNRTYLSNSPKRHTTTCDTCSNSPSFCPGL